LPTHRRARGHFLVLQAKSLEKAGALFEAADLNKDGRLQLAELRTLLREASKEYSHLAEHARFLDRWQDPGFCLSAWVAGPRILSVCMGGRTQDPVCLTG
jgi:hypothetical protein